MIWTQNSAFSCFWVCNTNFICFFLSVFGPQICGVIYVKRGEGKGMIRRWWSEYVKSMYLASLSASFWVLVFWGCNTMEHVMMTNFCCFSLRVPQGTWKWKKCLSSCMKINGSGRKLSCPVSKLLVGVRNHQTSSYAVEGLQLSQFRIDGVSNIAEALIVLSEPSIWSVFWGDYLVIIPFCCSWITDVLVGSVNQLNVFLS